MIGQSLRNFSVAWFLIATLWPQSGRAQDDMDDEARPYVLVPKSAKRVKAFLTIEMKAPNILADEWSVYIAQIPQLPGQAEVKTVLFPRGKSAREMSEEARPILYAQIPSVGEQWRRNVKARVEYEATLIERRLERKEADAPAPPAVPPLDVKTRRFLLANSHQFDYNEPKFKAWLEENKLRRLPDESEVDFARKAFLAVRQGFKHTEGADVEHLASRVCEAGESDYEGLTAVFVAALRANGIPTRVLAGRMILTNGQPSKGAWPHARTEFFANGLGWVPADPAGAIRSGRKTQGLEYFGNDNGEFLTIHLGTDMLLDTYFGPKNNETLQNPAIWMIGSGNFDGNTIKVDVTVESEELNLTDVITRLNARPSTKKQATKTSKKAG
jgi:transglutaminase-like putative cysteine protease